MNGYATEQAKRLLYLVRANPWLLSVAPNNPTAQQIDHRRLDEVHACLQCGDRADLAYAVQPVRPGDHWRWLDLCHEHGHAVWEANSPP